MPKRIFSGILVSLLLIGILTLAFNIQPVRAATPSVYIINPGPYSRPAKWSASSTARGFNTSNFTFYSNETAVGSTFFVNLTICNVANMELWGFGLIFDNTTLAYVSSWRPSDHVFSAIEAGGTRMVAPAVVIAFLDATHQEVLWGCTYIMPDPPETFNGTGVLCQIQFKITGEASPARPRVSSLLAIDPLWTGVYYYPTGNEMPTLNSAYVNLVWVTKDPGDLNNDKKVDMGDMTVALNAFGSYPDHPRWNPIADTNFDGRVDMGDIIIVLTNFGHHYP